MNALGQAESFPQDRTAKVLISILIFVVVACWITMIWGAYRTHQEAPPIPEKFMSETGQTVMTSADIILGKEGFQKAGLMDFGSLYGMGSYFGEDYTARFLVELGEEVSMQLAYKRYSKPLQGLDQDQKDNLQREMQKLLHGILLQPGTVTLPKTISDSIISLRQKIADDLLKNMILNVVGQKPISLSKKRPLKLPHFSFILLLQQWHIDPMKIILGPVIGRLNLL